MNRLHKHSLYKYWSRRNNKSLPVGKDNVFSFISCDSEGIKAYRENHAGIQTIADAGLIFTSIFLVVVLSAFQ